ncbi:TonB-dependent receptor plug domain-containing protein [Tenacibaculum tangerinum]|uniref:TonB-dependent receptor plug domain-containing protein n=1 Tax=Tenacibaculum tangerinum TaxID=3038772 RepID=A0ABY8L7R6_9FLAO|nr:TonB-dependent receptor plug domain-containing protein [Tenacibaculum tangerinum]WGH76228.1 TonB-dependent receptor plug domain-containing protein [Tenacibaculum tangerinum]
MKIKLSVLFLCLAMSIFSQEKVDITFVEAPLQDVLKQMEASFGVKFSFNPEIIKEKSFSFTKKECELVYLINEIERKTPLIFNQINERYYYITKNSNFNPNEYNLLNEVLVTNHIKSGINKKRNGTITVHPKDLGVLPGLTEPDVLESLKIIPGVQSPDETAAGVYIRGGTPNQNLILWDGIKMYYSGHFFGMISAFNPYVTEEITLSKSGTSARYGNRVSGVIDIKSNNEIPKKTTGNFGLNMTHADAYVNIPVSKKASFLLSMRRSYANIIKTPTFNNISTRVFQTFDVNQEKNIFGNGIKFNRENNFNFADYTAKLNFSLTEEEQLSLSFLYTKNKLFNSFEIPDYKDFYTDDLSIKNAGFGIQWTKKVSERLTHHIKGYFSSFKLNYTGKYNYIDNFLIFFSSKNNLINDVGVSYNFNYELNDKASIFAGYDFTSTESEYELKYLYDIQNQNVFNSLEENNGNNNTSSLFGEFIYDNDNWNINLGTRLNYFSKIDKYVIEPRLYLEKKITQHLRAKASFEQKHQTLVQIIEFQTASLGFDLENQLWTQVNNDNVPLQKSLQVSSGILFNKDNWSIDIEPYYKKVSGMTSLTSGYNDQSNDFSNGEGKIYGVDVLVHKKFNNYRTWINYSYTKNRFKFLDLENTFFPANHDITNYFSWSQAYKLNNYEFSLGWILRTGNPYTEINEFVTDENGQNPIIYLDWENINALRLPRYSRFDASVTYSFNLSDKWKSKIGFSLLNIFDRKNILNRTYNTVPFINSQNNLKYQLKEVDKVSLGITPNFVFRVSF